MEITLSSQDLEPLPLRKEVIKKPHGILNSVFKSNLNNTYAFKNNSRLSATKTRLKSSRFLDTTPTVDALFKFVIFSTVLLMVV